MSKDDTTPGLLSKMVKFVRHPATSWSELDEAADEKGSGYSKQALKEMIERKRRNDFVRKREFDMLRKLRTRMATPEPGYGGRPSFFQSSYSSKPDDRAGTLKKIDEIEAQMSMQWWKTKQGDSRGNATTLPPPDAIDTLRAYRTTVGVDDRGDVRPTVPADVPRDTARTISAQSESQPMSQFPLPPDRTPVAKRAAAPGADSGPTQPSDLEGGGGSSTFSASKYYALDVQEVALDPEIEEAAIRFASGDDAAAEQGLLDILTRRQASGSVDEWLALFDLYRATGRLESFDGRAIDFANRFSRSAPQWFSMKDEVASRRAKVFQPSADLGRAAWVAEADLDLHTVTLMARVLERAPQPWVLDWSALRTIQQTALTALMRLFHVWANEPVDLRFVGARQLRNVLSTQTRSGDRGVLQSWWTLRLAVLRVMDMGDDFEMAALDFCVTYEVSPPGWEPPKCHFKSLQTAEEAGLPAAPAGKARRVNFVDSSPSVLSSRPPPIDLAATGAFMVMPQAELVGEILSDAQSALQEVDRKLEGATVLEVSCKYLIRVDFSSAGGILNWASAHKQKGHEVRFIEVHRLIAAFFHVIGITEYAKVTTRTD